MNPHPTADAFEELLHGTLSNEQASRLGEHLTHREECRRLMDRLTDLIPEGSGWAEPSQPRQMPLADETDLSALQERLCKAPLLDMPASGSPVEPPDDSLNFLDPPQRQGDLGTFGGFRVLRELGRGGMGIVLLGYDPELERTVALKVLWPNRVDAKARSRILREARTLAGIDQDNIVKVHWVEELPNKPPCLVMQYVPGLTLLEQIRLEKHLVPEEAARLCLQVAEGLLVAHCAGLIHRDIKPGNIIIDSISRRAKIVDFGLVRSASSPGETIQQGKIAGTPEYVSPEQLREPEGIDARTDVYSLGVTLYEAVTGEVPFRGVPHMVVQQVLNEDPRLPRRLNDRIPRDLETVCLKCLEKDPRKRYASAKALADDLQRFLNGQSIQARPVGTAGKIWRWCGRNRLLAAASGAAATAMVMATVVSIFLAAHKANAAEKERRASKFLVGLLQASDPVGIGSFPFGDTAVEARRLSVREFLDENAQKTLIEAFKDQPDVQTRLMDTIGNLCRSLALYPEAKNVLESSHQIRQQTQGRRDADVATSLYYLAWLYHDQGDYDEAERLFREAIEIQCSKGHDDPLVVSLKFNLAWLLADMEEYASAEQLFREVLENRRQQPDSRPREAAIASIGLAIVLLEQGQGHYLEALDLTSEALRDFQNQESGKTAVRIIVSTVSAVAKKAYFKESAAKSLRECAEICRLSLGDEHPYVTIFLTELALTQEKMGEDGAAEESYRECLKIASHTKGYWHPRIAKQTRHLATLLARKGRYQEGERLFEELLEKKSQESKGDDRRVADTLTVFGWFLAEYSDKNKAEEVLREALRIFGKTDSHFTVFHELCLINLGRVLVKTGQYSEAESLLRKSLPIMQKRLGKSYGSRIAPVLSDLAWALMRQGRRTEGELTLRKALPIDRNIYSEEPKDMASRASIFSLAAAAVVNDTKLDKAEREKLAEQYAGLALGLLRKAHRGGYFKNTAQIEELKKDVDLAPLLLRKDFERLVNELSASCAN